jgi:predicted MFS family arabinose efflux permease
VPQTRALNSKLQTRNSELIALLCGAVLIITSNMGMLGPLLLQLSEAFEVSLAQAGLLATGTALPWAAGAPILGPLSDRFGRRRTLAASMAGLGLATCGAAFVSTFALLMTVRVISGLLAAAGPTSLMAAVGDHFPASGRASALGWVNAGFGFSALVGVPAVGAVGGAFGWRWAFIALGVVTVALAAVIWWRLPGEKPRAPASRGMTAGYRTVFASPGLVPILAANVLERSVFATVGLYLAAFLMQTYAIGLVEAAPLLALIAIGTIVGNVVGGRAADRTSRPHIFTLGQLISGLIGLAFFVLSPGLAASVALGAGFGLATSASRPAIVAMASSLSAAHRGTALGIFSFTNQLGWAAGPAASGLAFAFAGYPAIGVLAAAAATGAAAIILPLSVSSREHRHHTGE